MPGGSKLALCIIREGGPDVQMEVHAGFGLDLTTAALTTFALGTVILLLLLLASSSAPSFGMLPRTTASATATTSTALSEMHLAFLAIAGPVQLMVGHQGSEVVDGLGEGPFLFGAGRLHHHPQVGALDPLEDEVLLVELTVGG